MTHPEPEPIPEPEPTPEPEPEPKEEEGVYALAKPMIVGQRTLTKLNIDSRALSGSQYFKVAGLFRQLFPMVAQRTLNKYDEDEFVMLTLAELNQIAVEDLRKLSFTELPLLFMRARSFLYAGGPKPE